LSLNPQNNANVKVESELLNTSKIARPSQIYMEIFVEFLIKIAEENN